MGWQFSSDLPVYRQIVSHIRQDIISGRLAPDAQVPAVRTLAFEASVNPNTMQRALTELETEGLLISKGTVGRFVTSDTNILEKAKKQIKNETMDSLIAKANAIGITNEEIIDYVKNKMTECEVTCDE